MKLEETPGLASALLASEWTGVLVLLYPRSQG
jgi:hypothetical protein